uniref:Arf-GAP with dual PH domain-containing protein 1 isoform X1 n=1 Tax=Castor canadensis TaxID=51338 RepID=A0A8B7V0H9_CASCN|nr:arf-GAP with dual PH domain-containing protein 1 isoform X1 [Castor canadensis]
MPGVRPKWRLLREQWIRAKYERQEFILPEKQEPYSAGYREGFLWKRGRDNGQFLSRKFVLTEREGALKYFNKNDAKEPKAVMKIEHLNATFQPAKIGHPHGLQVTYLKDNSTRNIFVYHEDGKEIVDWFNALRAARFHYLQVAFPGASDADLVPKLSRNYLKEGYMEKTGPKVGPQVARARGVRRVTAGGHAGRRLGCWPPSQVNPSQPSLSCVAWASGWALHPLSVRALVPEWSPLSWAPGWSLPPARWPSSLGTSHWAHGFGGGTDAPQVPCKAWNNGVRAPPGGALAGRLVTRPPHSAADRRVSEAMVHHG